MAKMELMFQARKLREQGLSIGEIKIKLGVSKSSVSVWCRDIVLSPEKQKLLLKRYHSKSALGRLKGAEANKQKRLDVIVVAEEKAKLLISNISDRDRLFIAIALYWSEGAKSPKTFGFQFINSDSTMILFMYEFLVEILNVKKEDILCSIQINEFHTTRKFEVLSFWQKLLELPSEQINKLYLVKSVSKKVYQNHETYFGTCRLMVRRSTGLKYEILALIKVLRNSILSA